MNPPPFPTPGGDLIPFSILLNGEGRAELPGGEGGVEGDACVGHLASRVRGKEEEEDIQESEHDREREQEHGGIDICTRNICTRYVCRVLLLLLLLLLLFNKTREGVTCKAVVTHSNMHPLCLYRIIVFLSLLLLVITIIYDYERKNLCAVAFT